jgi:ankyrin repeat protein
MQSTPLGMACADGHASVVKLLIAAGADPAHVDGAGDTPLSEATANEHDEVVLLLRAAGAVSSDDAE